MPSRIRRHWRLAAAVALITAGVATAVVAGAASTNARPSALRGGLVRAASRGPAQTSASSATAARTTTFGPVVGDAVFDGESPLVSSLPIVQFPSVTTVVGRDNESLRPQGSSLLVTDPVVQKAKGSGPLSAPIANFDGVCLPSSTCAQASGCGCLPPDTNGEAGATQYVEMVNTNFAVYSKTGAVLRPSTEIDALWAGTNSECAAHNEGDPVVVYDQLANRWLLSQFIATPGDGEQYGECIAISKTGDATGSYYLYTFLFGPDVFYDYPHIGVWPDGYYMTANEFPTGQETSSGAGAFAFERSKMLQGKAARYVFFDESAANPTPATQYIGQLPGDLDGTTQPPPGTPNVVAEVDDPSGIPPTTLGDTGFDMRLWKFHVDWANPSQSTFGNGGQPSYTLPVAPFVRPQCVYGYGPNCAPQKGGPQGLDVLGDRLMFRLPYRQFTDHGSLVVNHTVVADARDGVRWYEVRFPKTGAPSVYQQGTYAPTDGLWRWMGSAAMDHVGDIAVGYSASGPADFPSVRYTGRAAGDPLGQLTQAEQTAVVGSGPQTQVEGRWGDYSDLSVDPGDDCTFWYAQEYLGDDLIFGAWRTRVASFRFPGCKK